MFAFISSIGAFELLLIGVLVLIFIGPKRLPQLAQTVGKGMREFKTATNEIQREVYRAKEELIQLAQDGIEDELDEMGVKRGDEEKKISGGLGVSSKPPAEGPIKTRTRNRDTPEGAMAGNRAYPSMAPKKEDGSPQPEEPAEVDNTPGSTEDSAA